MIPGWLLSDESPAPLFITQTLYLVDGVPEVVPWFVDIESFVPWCDCTYSLALLLRLLNRGYIFCSEKVQL